MSDDTAPTAPPPPQRVEIAVTSIWQAIGAVLATLALLRMVSAARGLLSMVAIAFFFSLALDPAVRRLHTRYGWRRGAAVGVIYVTGTVALAMLVFVLIPALQVLADTIATNAQDWIAQVNGWTTDRLGFPLTDESFARGAAGSGAALGDFSDDAFGRVLGLASAGIALVFNVATIAMFTFYFTADAPRVKRSLLRLFTPTTQERVGWMWDQAIVQTGGYFYSRLLLMAINGVGFFLVMVFVGVPTSLALALALFGGFVSVFIPAIGTYLGGAVPLLVTLAVQGLVPGLVVLGYVLVYQQVENYWLSPKISADTMDLNPGVAFGAALAGGAIAGPMGAFVALPVAALVTATISTYANRHEIVHRSPGERDRGRATEHGAGMPTGSTPGAG